MWTGLNDCLIDKQIEKIMDNMIELLIDSLIEWFKD